MLMFNGGAQLRQAEFGLPVRIAAGVAAGGAAFAAFPDPVHDGDPRVSGPRSGVDLNELMGALHGFRVSGHPIF